MVPVLVPEPVTLMFAQLGGVRRERRRGRRCLRHVELGAVLAVGGVQGDEFDAHEVLAFGWG